MEPLDPIEEAIFSGHTDEIVAEAISEAAQLVASGGKDGTLNLWREDERNSVNGNFLAASTKGDQWGLTIDEGSMRVWNLETGEIAASIKGLIGDSTLAPDKPLLFLAVSRDKDHEIGFYDLTHPDQKPMHVAGKNYSGFGALSVSPDGKLVASASDSGQVRLFSASKGELIESVQGHLNGAHGVAFSPDGRRLISTSGGREAVKLWDVGTRQELLTLSGSGSLLNMAKWSAAGDVILAGPRWQAWWAPSWEEIAAAELLGDATQPASKP